MICPCGGALFQFEPGPHGAKGVALPVVCRRCGRITIDGKELELPIGFKSKMAGAAEEAAKHASRVRHELTEDPNGRIESYFSRVYQAGYMHGFFLALAYFKHQQKEGRLVRLRALWKNLRGAVSQEMHKQVDEFDLLINMGAKDAASPADGNKTG